MLQLVAGLTVAFVGYVLYEVFKTVSSDSSSQAADSETAAAKVKLEEPAKLAAEAPTKKPEPVAGKAEPLAKKAESPARKAAVKEGKPERPAEEAKTAQLKDPVSGDIGPAPTNYRFAKKWVKDALVAEGLLDKVYKTADLDAAGSQKVREALEKLKAIKKYHG